MRPDVIPFIELLSAHILASFELAPSIVPFSMPKTYFASHFCPSHDPESDRFLWIFPLTYLHPEYPLGLKIG